VDVAEILEAVTDELKKVQKRGIFGSFSETVCSRKSLYIPFELFCIKKICVFLVCLRLKKISLETFGLHCVRKGAVNLILLPSWAAVGI